MTKSGKLSDEELILERLRLRAEIAIKENELNRLKKQLEVLEDALYVFTIYDRITTN